jgi:hypothetical protein
MKNLALATMILTLIALSGSAFARTFRFHGTICYHTATNFSTDYSHYGINNIGNSPVTIECPLPLSSPNGVAAAVTRVDAMVADRSSSDDPSCLLEEVNKNGAILQSVVSFTQGGGPGAPPVDLPFFPPAGDTSGYWRVRCTLPGAQPGGFPLLISQTSLLVSITVKTSE